jgi:L-ascorbate metabolism protein UlaG (beta-lactamase superfamily)
MFLDMAVIGEVYEPDIALVNIGGHFGMEPAMAARAARMVKARAAVAHHYGTFPVLTQDTKAFEAELKKAGVQYVPMKPGQSMRFAGSAGAAAGK